MLSQNSISIIRLSELWSYEGPNSTPWRTAGRKAVQSNHTAVSIFFTSRIARIWVFHKFQLYPLLVFKIRESRSFLTQWARLARGFFAEPAFAKLASTSHIGLPHLGHIIFKKRFDFHTGVYQNCSKTAFFPGKRRGTIRLSANHWKTLGPNQHDQTVIKCDKMWCFMW